MQYYDFPSVSMRAAVHPLMRAGVDGFKASLAHPPPASVATSQCPLLSLLSLCCQEQGQGQLPLPLPCSWLAAAPAHPCAPACQLVAQVDKILDTGHFASLEGRLPWADIADMDKYFYWDKSHPTDGGHEVLAELLASVVLRAVAEVEAEGEAAAAAAAAAAGKGAGAAEAEAREAAAAAATAAFDGHLQLWPRGSRMDAARGKKGGNKGEKEGLDSLPAPMIPGTTDAATTLCAIQVPTGRAARSW